MFSRIKQRFNDMGTIKALCERAEHHALQDQQREPGAEHFLLSALDLPDGTARRAFARVGADASDLPPAIARQYAEALRPLGLDPLLSERLVRGQEPLPRNGGAYAAAPSAKMSCRHWLPTGQATDHCSVSMWWQGLWIFVKASPRAPCA